MDVNKQVMVGERQYDYSVRGIEVEGYTAHSSDLKTKKQGLENGFFSSYYHYSFIFQDIGIMDTNAPRKFRKVSKFNCKLFASGRECMPASLILLAYSQSHKTMRNTCALFTREEGWESMLLPHNVSRQYTWHPKVY